MLRSLYGCKKNNLYIHLVDWVLHLLIDLHAGDDVQNRFPP